MQRRSRAAIAVARLVGTTRTRTRRDQTSIAATTAWRLPSEQITSAGVESSSQSWLRRSIPAAASPAAGLRCERCRSGLRTADRAWSCSARQSRSQRRTVETDGARPCRAIRVRCACSAVRCRPLWKASASSVPRSSPSILDGRPERGASSSAGTRVPSGRSRTLRRQPPTEAAETPASDAAARSASSREKPIATNSSVRRTIASRVRAWSRSASEARPQAEAKSGVSMAVSGACRGAASPARSPGQAPIRRHLRGAVMPPPRSGRRRPRAGR